MAAWRPLGRCACPTIRLRMQTVRSRPIADIAASAHLARKRSLVHLPRMGSRSQHFVALAATCSLLAGVAGCRGPTPANKSTAIGPDRSQVAFFDRPMALAAARTSSSPSPLIVMSSSDPWLMVIGSDSPTFALYSDGTEIFRTKSGYQSTKLDRHQLEDFVQTFDRPDLEKVSGRYVAADFTDQPDNSLLVYSEKIPFYITVYGSLQDRSVRYKLPAPVLNAFDRLMSFSAMKARPWLPSKVEVIVWPYEYAPDQSIVWPSRWPRLEDPTTRKRGDSYSIFIPSSDLPALKTFLANRKEKGAVEIDGKKWAASIRLPFPQEGLWLAPRTK